MNINLHLKLSRVVRSGSANMKLTDVTLTAFKASQLLAAIFI